MTKGVLENLTIAQKAALVSGNGMWQTTQIDEPFVPSVQMNDGPHGLRVQTADEVRNINTSKKATCFPTACATASSWDEKLIEKMGEAIGEEALAEKVSMVLGPGINIKRSPLCGRNFEYFSEDPFLAGRLAAAWIDGVQSKKVGTSLKHFAANSQETKRMLIDSVVDERALREIYLAAFEYAVKNSNPTSIMAAYNKLNGTYCTENKYLLTEILRNEWGYKGIVVSDWGATTDIVECIKNGMDLEMPGTMGYGPSLLVEAIENGTLSEEDLDRAAANMLKFVTERSKNIKDDHKVDYTAHHLIAKDIAAECGVLLKNDDNILPLDPSKPILVVGTMAEKMRFQGSGSSHINTDITPNLIDALTFFNVKTEYVKGYSLIGDEETPDLFEEAVEKAKSYDTVIFCGGLTESFEGEGYDRETLDMPSCQNRLISKLAKMGKNVVVVLFGGSPISMPWLKDVKAVLHMYLGGQAVGEATHELLYGLKNPCGKLAETYPLKLSDTPCYNYFANGMKVQHRESIFVGYRYYDTFNVPVLFEFGYGLSYTTFEYSDLNVVKNNVHDYTVTLKITNTGKMAGKEIVQLYIEAPASDMIRAKRELKGFAKTKLLAPGQSQTLTFKLDKRSFAYYSVEKRGFEVAAGEYTIQLSASLNDVRLSKKVNVEGSEAPNHRSKLPAYFERKGKTFTIPDKQYELLLGRKIEEEKPLKRGEYTLKNTLEQLSQHSIIARLVIKIGRRIAYKNAKGDTTSPTYKMVHYGVANTPLVSMPFVSDNMIRLKHCKAIVALANGRPFKALGYLLGRGK